MIYVFLAEGFEEIEALAPVDVLRRAGFEVNTVGVTGANVTGSHKITVRCDIELKDAKFDGLEAVILPGGMPGTVNLEKSARVMEFADYAAENGLVLGAICAAPSILGHRGLLNGKKATCFTGFEKELKKAVLVNAPAVHDGKTVTGWGAGAAFDFAFELLYVLTGDMKKTADLRHSMRCVDNNFLRGKVCGR